MNPRSPRRTLSITAAAVASLLTGLLTAPPSVAQSSSTAKPPPAAVPAAKPAPAPAAPAASPARPAATPTASIKPGVWETTASSENTQTTTKRSLVGRSCIAAADAGNPARLIPAQREPGMQCENRDIKQEGGTISWSIACKSADSTQAGKGRLTLFGDSYAGAAEVELKKAGAKPVKVNQSFSGKWLQACS